MTINHILFAIDFSERSRALKGQVEWLAKRFGCRVTLLHIFEIPASWCAAPEATFVDTECLNDLRASAQQHLDEYVIETPDDRVQRVIREGDAAHHILKFASEQNVDLIVMGSHGYGALQGWILGSVTAKVLHNANCPVWMGSLQAIESNAASKIICAIEIPDDAVSLLLFTKDLAQQFGASVRVVHSVPELETRPNRYFDFDLHSYLMESARVDIAKAQRQAGTDFPVAVSGTGVSQAIAGAAIAAGANLIVIGRGKVQKLFGRFQTHAFEIIRNAPCPVLSYSLNQQDGISSSCNAEHLSQYEAGGAPLTGSPQS